MKRISWILVVFFVMSMIMAACGGPSCQTGYVPVGKSKAHGVLAGGVAGTLTITNGTPDFGGAGEPYAYGSFESRGRYYTVTFDRAGSFSAGVNVVVDNVEHRVGAVGWDRNGCMKFD